VGSKFGWEEENDTRIGNSGFKEFFVDVTGLSNYLIFSRIANFFPRPLRFGGNFANPKGSKVSTFS
jgi:hypothetical protein